MFASFRFASPDWFYLLLLIPMLIGAYLWAVQRYRRRLARFGDPQTVQGLMPEASPKRIRHKFVLCLASLALLVVAAARPQLGAKLKESSREGIELMLAVDVSNSMLAQDFEPNRLERTKYAIGRLLANLNQDRVGLIAFAGDAYVQLPITADYVTARNFVHQLSPDMVSKQGTAIGAAIDLAVSSFSSQSEGSRVLIIVSDGENHEDDPFEAAQRAAEQGIVVYTIGIGTPEGVPIRLGNDFLKDSEGNMVVTKLDEGALEKIALLTGGAYIRSTPQSLGLQEIIDKINETEKRHFKASVFDEYNEQYLYFVAAALILLLFEALIISRKNRILARFNIFSRK